LRSCQKDGVRAGRRRCLLTGSRNSSWWGLFPGVSSDDTGSVESNCGSEAEYGQPSKECHVRIRRNFITPLLLWLAPKRDPRPVSTVDEDTEMQADDYEPLVRRFVERFRASGT
jgi:hypothetical protein